MGNKLRIGLVGAGKFGGYHANKLAAHAKVDFVGVFDVSQPAAKALGDRLSISVFDNFQSLLAESEALIIASPAIYHGDYALMALAERKHILIEKPIAVDLKQAREIARIAKKNSTIVQIGHQERFVGRAIGLNKIPERPVLIRARRLNPYSSRGTDTSVTMDLMTHDIDLVYWLMGETAKSIAGSVRVEKSDFADHAIARLEFANGALAFLEASRLAESGQRDIEISYPSGTVKIDLNAKTLVHDTPFRLNKKFGERAEAKDSLGAGLNEFVSAIRTKRTPFISATDGLNAVETALKVDGAK